MRYIPGYIGTYTAEPLGRGRGIYRFKLDASTGGVEDLGLAVSAENPSYLALGPAKNRLYAVNEMFEGKASGSVSAFAVEPKTGNLVFLNRKTGNGEHPCHIAVNPAGSHGAVAHYTSGTLSLFSLKPDGSLGESVQTIQYAGSGPNPARQEGSHAHFFMFDTAGLYGFACDLGADRVLSYTFNQNAETPLTPAGAYYGKPGSGPRHGVFHPSETCGYFLNELDSTVDVLRYNGQGGFEKMQSLSTLPRGTEVPNTASAIKISPDGQFLYASNRGHDSIAVYGMRRNGFLEWIDALPSGGKTPRDFSIDPTGNFLLVCHQDSDNLAVFRIDPLSGRFGKLDDYPLPSGVCIIFRA
jgi:6-phosphogluconolactonase